jgi:hypothetical protein
MARQHPPIRNPQSAISNFRMVATYHNHGIHFVYPDNWELAEEDFQGSPRVITLQSGDSGFWTVHVYDRDEDPLPLLHEVERTMQQEYDSLEAERLSEQLGGFPAAGCNMEFYCLDLLVTARARAVRTDRATYLVLCQAESREFERLLPVFETITLSLLGVVEPHT